MNILLDVMGGDHSPAELVKGAVMASKKKKILITLIGDEKIIKKALDKEDYDKSRFKIIHTPEYITMTDSPFVIERQKKNSSMAVALKMLAAGEGDSYVGVGNTGALYSGATLIVKKAKGIRKAAIATILPFERPLLLLDSGANLEVSSDFLAQFAIMGAVYASKTMGISNPEVGLLNNGSEAHKGTSVVAEAYKILQKSDINFIGNIEGKEIPDGKCDVLVTDGFTGNIVLKYTEGMGSFMLKKMKSMFYTNMITKFSAFALRRQIGSLKKEFDASEYGGAPILGISKPVIKAHGNSNAKAIMNAIFQGANYACSGVVDLIAGKVEMQKRRNKIVKIM